MGSHLDLISANTVGEIPEQAQGALSDLWVRVSQQSQDDRNSAECTAAKKRVRSARRRQFPGRSNSGRSPDRRPSVGRFVVLRVIRSAALRLVRSVGWSLALRVVQFVGWSVGQLSSGWLVGQSSCRPVGRSVGVRLGGSVGLRVVWSVGLRVVQSVHRSIGRSVVHAHLTLFLTLSSL